MSEKHPPADDQFLNDTGDAPRNLSLPDDLPPVEPPSAGMIIQLFLVPAVIVAVIVGVYALFGRVASQELDWRQLTTDVRSENPHVRWRGALGLAQMLDADAQRGDKSQHLAARPEIASALADLYQELITRNSLNEEELKQIEFLSKALGRMEVPETIVPVLRAGIQTDRNHDVRKHSLIGLAMLAGTMKDNPSLRDNAKLVTQMIDISKESDPLFRHQAAFDLGLLASPAALERLEVLLEDPDEMVRVNAAIGLARNGKLNGLPVFHELLREAAEWKLDPSQVKSPEQESTYFERMLMVLNTIKAVTQLLPQLSPEEKATFTKELKAISESTRDAVLRTDSLTLQHQLAK
ncbi:HEAT repeat domain-containing protein [Planctomicrobium sp. SH661]|uniref:HEAT repeat domain-containing protein n=1 Tax=Planctomicrobium sp. SH661 TaxID=3448124 RepID=UPI003F5C1467